MANDECDLGWEFEPKKVDDLHIGYRIDTYQHETKNLVSNQWVWQNDQVNTSFKDLVIENPVKVIIHGYGEDSKRGWIVRMREKLLKKAMRNQVQPIIPNSLSILILHAILNLDININSYDSHQESVTVIQMDWNKGAFRNVLLPGDTYMQAVANVPVVAGALQTMIRQMERHFNLEITQNAHIIGFSLGAHVAGFTGFQLQTDLRKIIPSSAIPTFSKLFVLEGKKLARISGLRNK